MAADTGVLLFLGLLQVAAIPVLLTSQARETRIQISYLVGLLGLNALAVLAHAGGSAGLDADLATHLNFFFDVSTGYLILAYAFERRGWRRRGFGIAAFGVLPAALVATTPALLRDLAFLDILLVRLPYYSGLVLVILDGAKSRSSRDAWVALAFLPRPLFFGTQVLWDPLANRVVPTTAATFVASAMVIALAAAAIWGVILLLRNPSGSPPRDLTVAAALLGPADALALTFVPHEFVAAREILNYLTLAVVRPVILVAAFMPSALAKMLSRSAIVAGVSFGAIEAAPLAHVPKVAALISVTSVASFALGFSLGRPRTSPLPPMAQAIREPPAQQWERFLRALRGSSTASPRPGWTQAWLAEALGIRVQRVADLPRELNSTAERKLDAYVPGWRSRHRSPVVLVQKHRGAVPGFTGTRLYYRLTPAGEELAQALSHASVGENEAEDPPLTVKAPPESA